MFHAHLIDYLRQAPPLLLGLPVLAEREVGHLVQALDARLPGVGAEVAVAPGVDSFRALPHAVLDARVGGAIGGHLDDVVAVCVLQERERRVLQDGGLFAADVAVVGEGVEGAALAADAAQPGVHGPVGLVSYNENYHRVL